MQLCFATNNEHKLTEIRQLVGERFTILSLNDIGHIGDIPEDFITMDENSLQKARFIYDNYDINCFADDSGLEVQVLGGEPGVFSARYAGPQKNNEHNIDKLLEGLKTFENRKAQFRCVITLVLGGNHHQFEGIVNGMITNRRAGGKGFGYDPVFIPNGFYKTFAEMSSKEKNSISHRGNAVGKLVEFLNNLESKPTIK